LSHDFVKIDINQIIVFVSRKEAFIRVNMVVMISILLLPTPHSISNYDEKFEIFQHIQNCLPSARES